MAGSSTPPSDETSYVKMTDVQQSLPDVSLVGTHCQLEYCNQLDFLPFYCQSCRKTFCLDHRTESAHKCANAGAWAERRRAAQQAKSYAGEGRQLRDYVSQKPCATPDCKTVIGTSLITGVHCTSCNRDYCLKHRLKEDHDCKNLVPLGARPQTNDAAKRARSALDKLRAWGSAKKEAANQAAGRVLPKPKPSTAAARMVAVNNLKKTAKGDDKLAPEKRVYLYVEAEAATTTAKLPKGQFFYSKDWVIGRVLDAAARSLQVENVNNQSSKEEDKLRVFHVEGGRVLEFNEKVGSSLVSGNTIVLLRGIGPAIPNLIEP
ncbi:uncharacterized protein E0L32_000543 [Thyridium curvatum]|uniref:AN1-type domain-containing protein n=1 Tax=Thyridium curvatum TaxID=1093900 RepID=A0A507B9T1_9PEZI|nr:uncharacterized protein E0L32_000543 [Thyridium curvatum]TPX14149.1 hypothetical protein E0L32_000543 [Thyridium curvatum]